MRLEYIIKTHTSEYLSVDTRPRVGDRVLIKSIDWYEKNKNDYDKVLFGDPMDHYDFTPEMSTHCGQWMEVVNVYDDPLEPGGCCFTFGGIWEKFTLNMIDDIIRQ